MKKGLFLVFGAVMLVFSFTGCKKDDDIGPTLSQPEAYQLVVDAYGSCVSGAEDICNTLTVTVENCGDHYQVIAIYDGLRDDSVRAVRKEMNANFINGAWELGPSTDSWKCGRQNSPDIWQTTLCP